MNRLIDRLKSGFIRSGSESEGKEDTRRQVNECKTIYVDMAMTLQTNKTVPPYRRSLRDTVSKGRFEIKYLQGHKIAERKQKQSK
jgi:hypothetical protein